MTLPEEGESTPEDENCTFEEFWLVARDAADVVRDERLFASGCARSSPAAAWCGAPPRVSVRVRGKVVDADWSVHALRCMSVYHSTGSYSASLEDFTPLRQSSIYFRELAPREESKRSWDFTRMRGSFGFVTSADGCPAIRRGPIPLIPAAELPAEFVAGGWRTLDMSRCAARIDAAYGFAPKGAAAPVALQLLATRDGSLFVGVEPLGHARTLPKDAVLRVCSSSSALYSYAYCHEANQPVCAQIALDGHVIDGDLQVEASIERTRFKIELPPDTEGVTVRYSEPASGRWLASTQQLPLDFTRLNPFFNVDADVARCELAADGLRMQFAAALTDLHEPK